jgi:dihydrofolate synthase/folylpolyglutamate synthase
LQTVIHTYEDAIAALLSLVDHERSVPSVPRQKRIYDLNNIELLLSRLGEPHRLPGVVHVAGTKGKGSTAAIVESILRAAGYSTGFYSSPHLHSFCERIRRDGRPIEPQRFADLTASVWQHHQANSFDPDAGPATLFEYLTAMAFLCFQVDQTDCNVVEVGLGGRLDATNVVSPNVCVITPVSLDHMAILGDTIGEIAGDKAGIIKPGVPVVVAPQSAEAADVIRQQADSRQSPVITIGEDVTWQTNPAGVSGQDVTIQGRLNTYRARLPLLGAFQGINAASAVAAVEILGDSGNAVTPADVVAGLSRVEWPCRLEVLGQNPTLVADGAHNDHSVDTVLATLRDYLPYRRLIVVAGFSRDKQVEAMVGLLAKRADRVIATRSRHPRSMRPADIAASFANAGISSQSIAQRPQVAQAVDEARSVAGKDDLILVTGSLFVAAEAREAVRGIAPETYPKLLAPDLVAAPIVEGV